MSLTQRCVKFEGICIELEDQKTERRAKKLQRKKAQKMAELERKEDIKYFLSFLQTVDAGELRRRVSPLLRFLFLRRDFPHLPTHEDKIDAFFLIVSTLRLPLGTRRQHSYLVQILGAEMDTWVDDQMYDPVIDRFLQHLRSIADLGYNALESHLFLLFPVDRQGKARQLLQDIRRLLTANVPFHAGRLSPETLEDIMVVRNLMQLKGSYNSSENAIRTASSGDSSDDDDVVSLYHF